MKKTRHPYPVAERAGRFADHEHVRALNLLLQLALEVGRHSEPARWWGLLLQWTGTVALRCSKLNATSEDIIAA